MTIVTAVSNVVAYLLCQCWRCLGRTREHRRICPFV